MVAQHLDHSAIRDRALGALRDHPLKFSLQRRQPRDARLHGGKLFLCDDVRSGAGLVGPVGEAEQVADGLERKSEITRLADESKPVERLCPVEPLVPGAACCGR